MELYGSSWLHRRVGETYNAQYYMRLYLAGAFFIAVIFGLFIYVNIAVPVALSAVTITLTDKGFEPREVTLVKGATVTFRSTTGQQYWPASNLHPEHTIYSEFDPKIPIAADKEWSFTFDRIGSWGFHDHMRSYFAGIIHVVEE